jgi:hypothetical protein
MPAALSDATLWRPAGSLHLRPHVFCPRVLHCAELEAGPFLALRTQPRLEAQSVHPGIVA